jgi:hypothetical protein
MDALEQAHRRRSRSIVLLGFALAVALVSGCGGDDGAEDGTTETDERADTVVTSTSTTLPPGPPSPIPFEIGNRWEYRIEYADPVGTVIYTQEVTDIEAGEDGDDATLRVDYRFINQSQPDFGFDIRYTVHPDGALSVPITAFAIGDVNFVNSGTQGALVWPSLPGIRDGDRKQGEFSATITGPEIGEVNADYRYDITGAGNDDVTVEAGSFPDAALMDVRIDITIHTPVGGPVEQHVTAQIWFAEGVGLVRHDAQGGVDPGTVTELISTNVHP